MLPKLSVSKPMTVVVAVILVIILGIISYRGTSTDLLPEMELPYVVVMTTYPGASPEEVETQITKPVEASLSLLSGLKSAYSTSAENVSTVILEFRQQTDMASVMVELSSMVNTAAAEFPDGAGTPVFLRLNPSMLPVMMLTADRDDTASADLSRLVEDELIPAFQRLEGVANVQAIGLVTRRAELVWDDDALEGYNDRILSSISGTLADTKAQLDSARGELAAQRKSYDEQRQQLYGDLADASNQLSNGRIQLELGQAELDAKPDQLKAQREELLNTRAQLESMLELYDVQKELRKGLRDLERTLDQLNATDDAISAQYGSVAAARRAVQDAQRNLNTAYDAYNAALATGDMETIAAAGAAFGAAAAEAGSVLSALAGGSGGGMDGGGMDGSDPAEIYAALNSALSQTSASLGELISGKREAEAAYSELKTQETMLSANLTMSKEEVLDSIGQIDDAVAQIDKALAVDIPQAQQELADARNELDKNSTELEKGKLETSTQLSTAGMQLAMAESRLDAAYDEFYAARDEAFQNAGLDGALTPAMMANILGAEHFSMPAGYVEDGEEKILLKVGDKFVSLEELQGLTLMDIELADIGAIKVSDVTHLEMTDDAADSYAIVNGNPGLILSIQKQSLSGTSEVSDDLNELISRLETDYPGLHLRALYDGGYYIDVALSAVVNNLLIGAVLAIIVLLLFLRSARPTAVIALSIPISLLFTLTLMYFSHVNLNVVSLAGLAMGVGMLVDNSIVVIENIYRMRAEGTPPREAAVYGAKQVTGAIVASTLTTVCVFLPILFTHGLTRQIFADMGLTVTFSLTASLLVALTLIPAAGANLLRQPVKNTAFFTRLVDAYAKRLAHCLRHKWIVFAVSGGVVVFCVLGMFSLGTGFMPEVDYGELEMTLTATDEDATLKETQDLATEAVERIDTLDYVDIAAAYDPGELGALMSAGEGVSMYVLLDVDAHVSGSEAAADIRRLTADMPIQLDIANSGADMSAMLGSGVQIMLEGEDLDKLAAAAAEVADIVRGVEGFEQIDDGLGTPAPQLRVSVDKNKAMEYGLTVAQVYAQLAQELNTETEVMELATAEGQYPVVITPDPDSRLTREKLADYKFTVDVPAADGSTSQKTVYLTDIASVTLSSGPEAVNHKDQTRYVQVSAVAADGYNMGLISRDLEAALAAYEPPAGVDMELAGENETVKDMLGDTLLMILLACVLIYLIMVAQFQNLLLPFIILSTIPLAFSGGLLVLIATGMEVSIVAMLGFLLLAGIIVNNGIVFIDRVNQLIAEGYEKREALITTGRQRLRPILMTALTTICSMLALIFSPQMGSELIRPMAIATASGMVYATVLTLFLVPALYDIFKRKKKEGGAAEIKADTAIANDQALS